MSTPIFYLKINTNTEFAVKCFEHWVDIAESYGADYYVVCDKEELKARVCEGEKNYKFIESSQEAKKLIEDIIYPSYWLNIGAALLTPFYHAEENGFDCFFNIDADDTVMCCDARLCAKALENVKDCADKIDMNCVSLDMHSSLFERISEHWTFGVTYTKMNVNYILAIKSLHEKNEKITGPYSYSDVINLDAVFKTLGKKSIININTFYIENLFFLHQGMDMHYCEKGRYKYLLISQLTKTYRQIKEIELQNGIIIPERFIKIDASINANDCLDFLKKNEIFNEFTPKKWLDVDVEHVKAIAEKGKLVIFGSGAWGKTALKIFRRFGQEVFCFCDNNDKLWGTTIRDLKVMSFGELTELNKTDKLLVFISPLDDSIRKEIECQLTNAGIKNINPEARLIYPYRSEGAYYDN